MHTINASSLPGLCTYVIKLIYIVFLFKWQQHNAAYNLKTECDSDVRKYFWGDHATLSPSPTPSQHGSCVLHLFQFLNISNEANNFDSIMGWLLLFAPHPRPWCQHIWSQKATNILVFKQHTILPCFITFKYLLVITYIIKKY